jgi:hypothetical protein
MKKYLTIAAGVIASATLMFAAAPVVATNIDVNIGVPAVVVQPQPVYVQPRPVYIRQQYENEWRERQVRAIEWRDYPENHGQEVSAAVHARNDARKNKGHKHHGKGKHGH